MNAEMPTISSAMYHTTAYNMESDALVAEAAGQAVRRMAIAGRLPPALFEKPKEEQATMRRIVQVYIADPDENMPLENALLYKGEAKFTDATDQELFFEIDINSKLKVHNELRKTIVNKKVKERTEYLEPAKIRDLKMVVVEVAKF